MSVTSVRINDDLISKLETTSKELIKSKEWVINEALRYYLKHREIEKDRWFETLKAIDEADKGSVIQSEDIFDWLNTWGTAKEKFEDVD
ncbi:MAG: ribbon-helix-helix protein, CopG family [Nitrospirae bacterium]|nr:ribbon-helix-helix protein, CopG family [Nitrospirota bacterium]